MKPKVSPSIRTYVKNAISKNLENKVYVNYGSNLAITTAGSGSNPTFVPNLLPPLVQGGSQQNRIGNEVKIKYAYVRGYVNLLPYSVTNNPLSTPIMVKMWLCASKTINTNAISSTDITTTFFETGSGSAGFQGNMLDLCLSNNKDSWTIYATKKFELGATYASSGGQVGTGGYFDNSKMTIPFYFSYGRHFKSSLKYTDQATNIPTNRNLFLVIQAVNADGSSTAVSPAEYHFQTRITFEDG